jgi:hypothetical protein
VVQLGFLHTPLAVFVVKELKNFVERLLIIVDNINKSSSLAVAKEFIP